MKPKLRFLPNVNPDESDGESDIEDSSMDELEDDELVKNRVKPQKSKISRLIERSSVHLETALHWFAKVRYTYENI